MDNGFKPRISTELGLHATSVPGAGRRQHRRPATFLPRSISAQRRRDHIRPTTQTMKLSSNSDASITGRTYGLP